MARRALLDTKPLNADRILTGPESLTYGDVRIYLRGETMLQTRTLIFI